MSVQRTGRWGLETTAPTTDALLRLERLIDDFVTFDAELPTHLGEAVAEPAAPMAHVVMGLFLAQANTAADHLKAAAIAEGMADVDLNPREALHRAALTDWLDGESEAAIARWEQILQQWPTDMFALRMQYFALFSRGRCAEMLASSRRSIDAWGDLDRRTYLEGMASFALEELGEYDEAERLGRTAVEADPTDLWSIHAVAHVLEMQARSDDGLIWFEGRDDVLHSRGSFARHLWWHHAIIHLRTGNHGRLLELYDTEIQPGDAIDALSLTNAIDGLARLEFAGVDVGDRWLPLLEPSTVRIGHHTHPFADAHFAYAIARAGAEDQVAALLDGMASWRDRSGTASRVISQVGLDTATAMAALGAGRANEATPLFERTQGSRWQLGGSHAQREVFELAQRFAATTST
mgnify:CR=1 FL=1